MAQNSKKEPGRSGMAEKVPHPEKPGVRTEEGGLNGHAEVGEGLVVAVSGMRVEGRGNPDLFEGLEGPSPQEQGVFMDKTTIVQIQ